VTACVTFNPLGGFNEPPKTSICCYSKYESAPTFAALTELSYLILVPDDVHILFWKKG
jgi:hypothetical protein